MEKQTRAAACATIQADVATFKELVQRLTGGGAHKLRPKPAAPFKLRERRKPSLRDLEIAGKSPAEGPATPLGRESVATESPPSEERAVAAEGFYLHASPAKAEPPALLTLFPLTPK